MQNQWRPDFYLFCFVLTSGYVICLKNQNRKPEKIAAIKSKQIKGGGCVASIMPTDDQLKNIYSVSDHGELVMVNLLRFKPAQWM